MDTKLPSVTSNSACQQASSLSSPQFEFPSCVLCSIHASPVSSPISEKQVISDKTFLCCLLVQNPGFLFCFFDVIFLLFLSSCCHCLSPGLGDCHYSVCYFHHICLCRSLTYFSETSLLFEINENCGNKFYYTNWDLRLSTVCYKWSPLQLCFPIISLL